MFGVMQHLNVVICQDAEEARRNGYSYGEPEFTPIEIAKAVVVRDGTQSGKSSVDLILVDETGKKFVVMLTGALLKSIPC